MVNVEIITSRDNSFFDNNRILSLLQATNNMPAQNLNIKGRAVTKIIADDDALIKLRTEYSLPELQARRFVDKAISREQTYELYHPQKTWFLLLSPHEDENSQTVIIGNISPLLLALNRTQQVLDRYSETEYIEFILQMIDMYFNMSIEHNSGLDLCLSNFGVDKQANLYYLDDDVYGTDGFVALTDFLGMLIRSETWLNDDLIKYFGVELRKLILHHYQDAHFLTVIAEQFKHLFLPPNLHNLRTCLVDTLYSSKSFSYHKPEKFTKVALIADIHANAPALREVLSAIATKNINNIIVLGDIVGYGPHPDQCVELVRDTKGITVIRGNHDHAVATGKELKGITSLAGWALNWTINNIRPESVNWLNSLPPYLQDDNWLAVHGAPIDKTFFNAYVYHMTYIENLDELRERNIRYCFHGHTHIQKIYNRYKGNVNELTEGNHNLADTEQALICPGSVGQPRGGEPGAEYAIFDLESLQLEFYRLSYDIDAVMSDMDKNSFPPALAERLLNGT